MDTSIIGYTCGVYDLLHIGHINLLKNAKSMCDKLIVGLSTDECIRSAGDTQCSHIFNEKLKNISINNIFSLTCYLLLVIK